MVLPVPSARAQPYHPGSGRQEQMFRPCYASSAWPSRRAEIGLNALCSLPLTAEAGAKHPFKRQLHTTHVGADGWEPQGSSPTACAGKVDRPKLLTGVSVNYK